MSAELRYSGSFSVEKPPEYVLEALGDLRRVVKCLPNVISYEAEGRDRARAKFRVDLGDQVPIAELRRISADVEILLVEASGNAVKYKVNGRAVGSTIGVDLALRVADKGGASEVGWEAVASLGRLLQLMRGFVDIDQLVKKIAEDAVKSFVSCI